MRLVAAFWWSFAAKRLTGQRGRASDARKLLWLLVVVRLLLFLLLTALKLVTLGHKAKWFRCLTLHQVVLLLRLLVA